MLMKVETRGSWGLREEGFRRKEVEGEGEKERKPSNNKKLKKDDKEYDFDWSIWT